MRQSAWALVGLLAMMVLMRVNYRHYNSPSVIFPCVAITTLLLLATFFMHDSHHTHRWIRFGIFSFQPSEIAKPALVLFLAWFLQNRVDQLQDWRRALLPAALPSLVFIALILKEPDLGTALVCAAVTALMLYLAGAQIKYLVLALLAASPVLYYMLFHVAWRRARMIAFLNPEKDPRGTGFHILQSLIAVGAGGIHGVGLMEGRQKLFYLPEPQTDFIFANIAEELGLIGTLFVVALFLIARVSRAARGVAVDGSVRSLPRLRHHRDHRHPGILQHQRGAGAGSHQGNCAAVHLRGGHVAILHVGQYGCALKHHQGD